MKVVLFCGGQGMRLREYSDQVPKPMVPVGSRPILWHLMRYYAYYGHRDFILCLGYQADVIKHYFQNDGEALLKDLAPGTDGKAIRRLSREIADWNITFAKTGIETNIAGRLCAVKKHLKGEEVFLANYADGLCDLPLDRYLESFVHSNAIAKFVNVRPTTSFHIVDMQDDGIVTRVQDLSTSGIMMNGGFFAFRNEIFNYIKEGEEIVNEPFERLIQEKRLTAERYDGFWMSMDTFKDKQLLDDLYSSGAAPWELGSKSSLHSSDS